MERPKGMGGVKFGGVGWNKLWGEAPSDGLALRCKLSGMSWASTEVGVTLSESNWP